MIPYCTAYRKVLLFDDQTEKLSPRTDTKIHDEFAILKTCAAFAAPSVKFLLHNFRKAPVGYNAGMGNKLTPKIILEGTRLTFKTEIAFALNEHPRIVGPRKYRYHSPLISAEWCAFTNFPWGRGLINFEPQEEAQALETYATWLRLFELQRYYSWIVDRFHISTRAYQLQALWQGLRFRLAGGAPAAAQLPAGLPAAQPGFLRGRPGGAPESLRQARPVRRPVCFHAGAGADAAAGGRIAPAPAGAGHLG